MRQYTTPDQTAKLIELGFEKPKGLADAEPSSGKWVREAYSIGELIEMLPSYVEWKGNYYGLQIKRNAPILGMCLMSLLKTTRQRYSLFTIVVVV